MLTRQSRDAVTLTALLTVLCALVGCSSSPRPSTTRAPARPVARGESSGGRPARRRAPRRADHGSVVATGAAAAMGGGTLITAVIPGTADGFAARPALAYLPPAASHTTRLPVLLLLHGTPGAPSDWVRSGGLVATMDAFAGEHGGAAPIVVMPDINGYQRGDSECVRTPAGGDVETYLTATVPQWILDNLPADRDSSQWAVAGVSEGGTCAAMLALRHRDRFGAFVDLSGQAHLTLGHTDDATRTIRQLFGGSRQAYDDHDPVWLLTHFGFPGLGGWFACGSRDRQGTADQQLLAGDAAGAGVAVQSVVVPGGHHWALWRSALGAALSWLWQRLTV